MVKVRIYQPAKTAMQSGRARTHDWVLSFEPAVPRRRDPLMGWTGSLDTREQVLLHFDTREEAVAYADRHGYDYEIHMPHQPRHRLQRYADRFRYDRPL